jgi:hypothetical protein
MLEFVVSCLTLIAVSIVITLTLRALRMPDTDFPTKKKELLKLFNTANSNIHIVTDLDSRFFGDEKVITTLKKAAERGVEIKIVCDPEGDKIAEIPKLERLANKGLIEVKEAKEPFSVRKIHHCMVVDEKAARLETYHRPKKFGEGEGKGSIYRVPRVALFAEREFKKEWEGTPINN